MDNAIYEMIHAYMDRYAKPSICLFRPRCPNQFIGRSYFGGLPTLPEVYAWPGAEMPMHFLAQIDCADLPEERGDLPASGMLFFFAPIDDSMSYSEEPGKDAAVIYAEHVDANIGLRTPPTTLPPIGGPSFSAFPLEADQPLEQAIYPKWPMHIYQDISYPPRDLITETPGYGQFSKELIALSQRLHDEEIEPYDEYGDELSRRTACQLARLAGEPEPDRYYSETEEERQFQKDSQRAPWRYFSPDVAASFPYSSSLAAQMAVQAAIHCQREVELKRNLDRERHKYALKKHRESYQTKNAGLFDRFKHFMAPVEPEPEPEMPDEPVEYSVVDTIVNEADEWAKRLSALAGAPLDQAVRDDFVAWLEDATERLGEKISLVRNINLGPAIISVLRNAIQRSTRRPALSQILPDGLCEEEILRMGIGAHWMIGYFDSSQTPEPMDSPLVPLLELNYDQGMGFYFCDLGEVQFFITPEDLRAKCFDNVIIKAQGG